MQTSPYIFGLKFRLFYILFFYFLHYSQIVVPEFSCRSHFWMMWSCIIVCEFESSLTNFLVLVCWYIERNHLCYKSILSYGFFCILKLILKKNGNFCFVPKKHLWKMGEKDGCSIQKLFLFWLKVRRELVYNTLWSQTPNCDPRFFKDAAWHGDWLYLGKFWIL